MRDKRVDSTPLYSAFLSGKRSPKQSENSSFCHLKLGHVWDDKDSNDFWLPYFVFILPIIILFMDFVEYFGD